MNEQNKDIDQLRVFFNNYSNRFSGIYVEDENPRSWFDSLMDKFFRAAVYQRFENTVNKTNKDSIRSILDIGCGPGHYAIAFLNQGKKVTALDIAEKMLDLTKDRVKSSGLDDNIDYILDDYLAHDFPNKYDAVCVMGFFDYVADPVPFIKKLMDDTNIEAYISVPTKSGLQALQRRIRYWINKCPLYLYTRSELESVLTESGYLENSEIVEMSQGWFVTIKAKG